MFRDDSVADRRIFIRWRYIIHFRLHRVVISWYYYESDRCNEVFDQNSKKRDLSGNLNQTEGAKILKEGSLTTSRASDIPDKMFTESLKSPDCVSILFNCIKNAEKQITQSFENKKEIGAKQQAELTEAIDFISSKFDEYKKR